MVMNYVETDLKKVLNQADQLDLSEEHLITIFYNILCSINFLHSCNLVHRDLKPANILLDDNCIPTICDFGISRSLPKISNPVLENLNSKMKEINASKNIF